MAMRVVRVCQGRHRVRDLLEFLVCASAFPQQARPALTGEFIKGYRAVAGLGQAAMQALLERAADLAEARE